MIYKLKENQDNYQNCWECSNLIGEHIWILMIYSMFNNNKVSFSINNILFISTLYYLLLHINKIN